MAYTHSAGISQAILFTTQDLSQDPPHYLSASGLGQIWDDVDCLRTGEWPDALADLHDHLLLVGLDLAFRVLERHESIDSGAGEFICDSDDCCFPDVRVLEEGGFDLCSREAVARHVDDVVDAAADPVVSLVVACCTVTSKLVVNKI